MQLSAWGDQEKSITADSTSLASIAELQRAVAKKVLTQHTLEKETTYICGVDVAYRKNLSFCSAVLMNKNNMEVKESINATLIVKHPYVAGYFMIREYDPIMNIMKLLKTGLDVLLVEGHGILHPRRCGLASYVGIMANKPTIGVAKTLLCGSIRADNFVELNGVVSGYKMIKQGMKPVYISVGHKIDLANAITIVEQLVKREERIPEPLRLADINSKKLANMSQFQDKY
jgi:deoxyribonuclease V